MDPVPTYDQDPTDPEESCYGVMDPVPTCDQDPTDAEESCYGVMDPVPTYDQDPTDAEGFRVMFDKMDPFPTSDQDPTDLADLSTRYTNYILRSIKRDVDELETLCRLKNDPTLVERVRALFEAYLSKLDTLRQKFNVRHVLINDRSSTEQGSAIGILNNNQAGEISYVPTSAKPTEKLSPPRQRSNELSSAGRNVDAPCFIPRSPINCDNNSFTELYNFNPRISMNDGASSFSQNAWHVPAYHQSPYMLPYYHMEYSNILPLPRSGNLNNYPSTLIPGIQGSGIPLAMQYPQPYAQLPRIFNPLGFSTQELVENQHMMRNKHGPRHGSRHGRRSNVLGVKNENKGFVNLPPDPQIEGIADDGKSSNVVPQTTTTCVADSSSVIDKHIKTSEIKNIGALPEFDEAKVDAPSLDGNSKSNKVASSNDLPDCVLSNVERLKDFPELSFSEGGKHHRKARRMRLPRVNYQKQPKISISDLFKTFGAPCPESDSKQLNKNLLSSSSFATNHNGKMEKNIYFKKKGFSANRFSVHTVHNQVWDKEKEGASDEAEGWKKVKSSRFKSRDGSKQQEEKSKSQCPSYQQRDHPRKSTYRNKSNDAVASNKCSQEHFPNQVLDLDYNNQLLPSSGNKLNKKSIARSSSNLCDSLENTLMVSKEGDTNAFQDELGESSVTPLADPCATYELFSTKDPCIGSHDLDNDPAATATLVLSANLEEDVGSTHTNVDSSMEDESTTVDVLPGVEDAPKMHEDFMKYLNCSTWPTQMDEIDKFESLIADNDPADPVLMHPSVSVEQFTEFIFRHPNEAQAFRREVSCKLKKINETECKQQQAHENRMELLKSKTAKVRGFVQKVKDVQLAQDKLAVKRKNQIDEKLRKAEENRKNYLSTIRRKAHDEEEKLREIAFINELEAQNRRHDSLVLRQEHEERIQCRIGERQRRVEEKLAKEAAVEERRRVLEAERQQKLIMIAEARRKKEETIDRKQQERETQRLVTARVKAREREERLLARDAAQRAIAEELQKRIQQKQEDSARRHEENIELIRQRALEIGLHRNPDESVSTFYLVSKCVNEEVVPTELDNLMVDYSEEKQKATKKKRCRKLRSRISLRSSDFFKDYPVLDHKLYPFGNIIDKLQLYSDTSIDELLQNVSALKGILVKLIISKPLIFEEFSKSRGFLPLSGLLRQLTSKTCSALDGAHINLFTAVTEIFELSVFPGLNWEYFILSYDAICIIDCLRFTLTGLSSNNQNWAKISGKLLSMLTYMFLFISSVNETEVQSYPLIASRMADIISYIMNSELVEKIINLFQEAVVDESFDHMSLIPTCIKFFSSLINDRSRCPELVQTLIKSDCFGTIPLIYEGLQKMGARSELPVYVTPIIELLLAFADMDVQLFQNTLGDDGMALQIRAIASNIMIFCSKKKLDDLLQKVVILVGYFAIKNVKNQTLLQSGQQPTVLQQLVTLPFDYFCDHLYSNVLFPTLYVCSYNNPTNRAIVENELSFSHLEDYINSERGRRNKMIELFYNLQDINV